MMLQEIRRRPTGKEQPLMEQERMRRQELYLKQLNERRQSHESLLQVQEQLLKIFAKLKVSSELLCVVCGCYRVEFVGWLAMQAIVGQQGLKIT